MAQRVSKGIALLFHHRNTRRGLVVSSTLRPHLTPGKGPVPILQDAGWVPGPVWTGGKSRPHQDSIPDRPAHSQSLYRPSYPAHSYIYMHIYVQYIYVHGIRGGGNLRGFRRTFLRLNYNDIYKTPRAEVGPQQR